MRSPFPLKSHEGVDGKRSADSSSVSAKKHDDIKLTIEYRSLRQAVFGLQLLDFLLLLLDVHRLVRTTRHSSRRFLPSRLEVENDEVAPTHVKAGEVVQRVLGIVNVLVHDERGSARLLRITTTNIRTKTDAHIRIWRMSPYFAKMSYSSSFVIL